MYADLAELALDPWVPPSRVLTGHPNDEFADLGVDGRSAGFPPRVRPLPLDQFSVPAEQGLRRDQERRPPLAWEGSRQGRKQGAIERPEPWSPDLSSQDQQLVTKDQDLEVLGPVASR